MAFEYSPGQLNLIREKAKIAAEDLGRKKIEATAYHEAGHAVIAILRGQNVKWAAIYPLPVEFGGQVEGIKFGGENLGMICMNPDLDHEQATKANWFVRLLVTYAGRSAEKQFTGEPVELSSTDPFAEAKFLEASGQDDPNQVGTDCLKLSKTLAVCSDLGRQWR